jgi:hypothetical protein
LPAQIGVMGKLLIILFLGGAIANSLTHANAQPPLLIDSPASH